MDNHYRFEWTDNSSEAIARQIHAVQMSAYAQEAKLLGAIYFPPLSRTVDDIRNCQETFFAAFISNQLVGAISTLPDPEGMGTNIATLVVAPSMQRKGIAKLLIQEVLSQCDSASLTVQTGVKNVPALNLYYQHGFIEVRRWLVGHEPLELVKLRRSPMFDSQVSANAV